MAALGTAAKTGLIAAAAGISALSVMGLKSAADLEKTATAMRVLTGNAGLANQMFAQLYKYAAETPFEFPEIAKGAKTLLGFGIAQDKIIPNIKMLGDLAGATGADFSSLATVFGQVNATGRLMGQDALQLINNNIPITTMLAKDLGISVQDVKKRMEAGAISVDQFNAALLKATQQGGFAFGGADALAKTFSGRMSTLKDQVAEFARNLVGVKIDPQLGLVVEPGGLFDLISQAIPKAIQFLKDFGAVITELKIKMQPFVDFMATQVLKVWDDLKASMTPEAIDFWKNLALVLGGTVVVAVTLVAMAIMSLVTGINWLVTAVADAATWIVVAFRDGFNFVKNLILDVWNFIKNAFSTGWDFIKSLVGTGVAFVVATFNRVREIVGTVTGAIGGVVNSIRSGIENAVNAVRGFFGRFKDAGKGLIDAIVDGIKAAPGKIVDAIKSMAGAAAKFLPFSDAEKGPFSHLTASGAAIPGTLAEGMLQNLGALTSAMNQMPAPALGGSLGVAGDQAVGGINLNFYPKELTRADIEMASSAARIQVGERLRAGV